jgi:hypothetical protein
VRIAQEIILQYIDIRQVATKLTHSQTAIHAQYAKTICKTVTETTTATMIATVMMKIATVNMTKIRFIAIAMIQATNDNYRH